MTRSHVRAIGISKSFGPIRAVHDVTLTARGGEILGLVGENGAGKSTLLSIIAGFQVPDAGEVTVDGVHIEAGSVLASIGAGVGMVHQHLALVPSFRVREQLELAGWRGAGLPPILDGSFSGDERIADLSMGQRQRVEIARVLVANPRVLLLDEPTSILAPPEVESLFALLRELRNAGVAVVIVTHKLREVMEVADRVVVLSRGQVTGEFLISGAGHRPALEQDILAAMFHRQGSVTRGPLDNPTNEEESIDGPPILTVRGLGSSGIRDVSFDLRAGEVAMMVGIDGNGQRALAEAIAGYRSSTGSVRLRGEDIAHLGAEARARRGISFLTDDRVGEGGVAAMTVADNVVLKRPAPRDGRASLARKVVSSWRVTPSDIDAPFGTLSGGNMQRVLIGRELARNPSVLIALNPAYGLDAETATTVWSRFRVFARNGAGVLVFTSDLDEALAHGDRVAVMRSGAVSGFEPVRAANRSKLGSQMVLGW